MKYILNMKSENLHYPIVSNALEKMKQKKVS